MDAAPYYRQPAATGCVPVTHDEIMQRQEELGVKWMNVEVASRFISWHLQAEHVTIT